MYVIADKFSCSTNRTKNEERDKLMGCAFPWGIVHLKLQDIVEGLPPMLPHVNSPQNNLAVFFNNEF